MGSIYGLAVVLFIFGGIIIQCSALVLDTRAMPETDFEKALKEWNRVQTLVLIAPEQRRTMVLIAEHLTNLKKMNVDSPGGSFLYLKDGDPVIKLPSVEHFEITFRGPYGVDKNFSFYMPKLKKLIVRDADANDKKIIKFVSQHSRTLKTLDLVAANYRTLRTLGAMKHIEEFVTSPPLFDIGFLTESFEQFDDSFKLKTLKFRDADREMYELYKATMIPINIRLGSSGKLTWTLSYVPRDGTDMGDIVFNSQRSTKS